MAKKKTAKKGKKVAAKKATKRASTKKTATMRAAAPKKIGTVKEAFNKTAIISHLAEQAGVTRSQVKTTMESLGDLIEKHVKGGAAGEFTLPGLLKIRVVRKPATKARKGINPFTGEEIMFKAKPARNVVKIKALKKLKAMVA